MMLASNIWESAFRMPQILFIIGGLIAIVGIIATYWYKAQKVRAEHNLKRILAERGMSADEIERIVAASPKADHE